MMMMMMIWLLLMLVLSGPARHAERSSWASAVQAQDRSAESGRSAAPHLAATTSAVTVSSNQHHHGHRPSTCRLHAWPTFTQLLTGRMMCHVTWPHSLLCVARWHRADYDSKWPAVAIDRFWQCLHVHSRVNAEWNYEQYKQRLRCDQNCV